MSHSHVAMLGGGIVGLATAYNLTQRYPELSLRVIEKEPDVGAHQTGHNSGVLHSGIYYKPGSLKARNCREGKAAMEAFCRENDIPFNLCGKVIVAICEADLPALDRIFERGQANGVVCSMIDKARLAEIEPHAAGIRAIHVPEAGIVDYPQVCRKLAEHVRAGGGEIVTGARVTAIHHDGATERLVTSAGEFSA